MNLYVMVKYRWRVATIIVFTERPTASSPRTHLASRTTEKLINRRMFKKRNPTRANGYWYNMYDERPALRSEETGQSSAVGCFMIQSGSRGIDLPYPE